MTMDGPVAQSAGFVAGRTGTRLRLVTQPLERAPRGTVIWVHAFAEEMNKTRRMSARMARLLALDGWCVVQKDLAGCGDSSGEFRDASWQDWIDDLNRELALAPSQQPIWLWCLRAGSLLAPALVQDRPDVNLMLWQPVVSGAQHLQQFLRLHAGARIAGTAANTAPTQPARLLQGGSTVEVGGYELSAQLANAMEGTVLEIPKTHSGRLVWMDVTADVTAAPSPAAQRGAERLQSSGLRVELEVVTGPPFWQTQEIEDCDALLVRTLALMNAARPDRGSSEPGAAK
jgi:exosortase A-associated hydrolase 2